MTVGIARKRDTDPGFPRDHFARKYSGPGQYLVMTGDMFYGFETYGPFDHESACTWAEDNILKNGDPAWVFRLQSPKSYEDRG